MSPKSVSIALALLLTATTGWADQARQRRPPESAPQGGSSDGGGQAEPRTAVPRGESPRESAPPPPPPSATPPSSTPRTGGVERRPIPRSEPRTSPQPPSAGDQRTAQPRDRRPPPGRPDVAVPRESVPPPPPPSGGGGRTTRGWGPRVYNNPYYYYYPRQYYPHGYGSFGLGYFYYDPYTWYPYDYNYRFRGYGYGYPTGELRLDVRPHYAEVYVDGYYAGTVDDFDGIFQSLELEEGPYTIEIVAPGFQTLVFNVRIYLGRKVTYRGDMRRFRP